MWRLQGQSPEWLIFHGRPVIVIFQSHCKKVFEYIYFCHFWDKRASDKMDYAISNHEVVNV